MQQINLFAAFPRSKPPFLNFKRILIAIGLVLVLGAVGCVIQSWSVIGLKKQVTALSGKSVDLNIQIAQKSKAVSKSDVVQQVEALKVEVDAKKQLVELINAKRINSQGFSPVLLALANTIPTNVWLQHIAIQLAGKQIQLTGRAEQSEEVSLFSDSLAKDPALKGYTLRTTQLDASVKPGAETLWNFSLEAKSE